MEYRGLRYAERDIIDDFKDEIVHLKKKMKNYKFREENMEDELDDITDENKKLKIDYEKIMKEKNQLKDLLEKENDMKNDAHEKEISVGEVIKRLRDENLDLEERLHDSVRITKDKKNEIDELLIILNESKEQMQLIKIKLDAKRTVFDKSRNVSLVSFEIDKLKQHTQKHKTFIDIEEIGNFVRCW